MINFKVLSTKECTVKRAKERDEKRGYKVQSEGSYQSLA